VVAPLGEASAGTELQVVLRSGRGAFASGPILPGSYPIAGSELDFATCGVCVLVYGDRDPDTGAPRQSYLATGGTVTIDSVFPELRGSLRDVALSTRAAAPSEPAPTEPAPTDDASACTTSIGAATFSVTAP